MINYKRKKIYFKGNIRYICFYINFVEFKEYRVNKSGEEHILKFNSNKDMKEYLLKEGVLK